MSSPKPKNIVVIGAGVIGLQIALTLLTTPPPPNHLKLKITLLASHFPGTYAPHYTSPWAGGQWRTHASPNTPSGRLQCSWDIQTYHYWKTLATTLPTSLHGIGKVKSRYVWDELNEEIAPNDGVEGKIGDGLWWSREVDDFRVLGEEERPVGTVYGVEWTSFCINVPRYLQYLLEEVKRYGGECVRVDLPMGEGLDAALRAAGSAVESGGGKEKVDLFVNATGLSARRLVGDKDVFPTRGQTVLVSGEAGMARTRRGEGYIAYTIPRPGSGTTVLGGANDAGSWEERVDEGLNTLILERTSVLAPELLDGNGKHVVLGKQVGFRPSRKGGPRVEFEEMGGRMVLHCYGHGGAGYQNSIGCAGLVWKMLCGAKKRSDGSAKANL